MISTQVHTDRLIMWVSVDQRSKDAGGEINGSGPRADACSSSGWDSGAVHPAKLATTRTLTHTTLATASLTMPA